jgi:hypothetical protein
MFVVTRKKKKKIEQKHQCVCGVMCVVIILTYSQ